MIPIANWFVVVPDDDYEIGYAGENNVHKLVFLMDDAADYSGWSFYLDTELENEKKEIALSRAAGEAGNILTCTIMAEQLAHEGFLRAQLRAVSGDGKIKKSNCFRFAVRPSVLAAGGSGE